MADIILMDLQLIIAAFIAIYLLVLLDPDKRFTLKEPTGKIPNLPFVSVILPARNEELNIGKCLESVLIQNYPVFEVIVIDDQSEDRTRSIAKSYQASHPNLQVVVGKSLMDGWLGKPWALWQGVQKAHVQSGWYLFLDADTRIAPDALSASVAYAEKEKLDMLCLFPHLECVGFWEKTVQPVMGFFMMLLGAMGLVNDVRFKGYSLAIGQFFLIRRKPYEEVGGHAAVKGDFVEDISLSKLFKKNGLGYRFVRGQDFLSTRMHKGLDELVEGWSRLIFPGLNYNVPFWTVAVFCFFTMAVMPYILFLWGACLQVAGAGDAKTQSVMILSLIIILISFPPIYLLRTKFNLHPEYAFTFPVAAVVLLWIFIYSLYSYRIRKRVAWKSRNYAYLFSSRTPAGYTTSASGMPPVKMSCPGGIMKFLEPLEVKRAKEIASVFAPSLADGDCVLDLGCGPLVVAEEITKLRNVHIIGCDVLNYQKRRFPLVLYNGEKLPFKDKSFDCVLIVCVLHHCGDGGETALLEAKRITRKKILILEDCYNHPLQRMAIRAIDACLNWVENPAISVPYKFRPTREWKQAFKNMSLTSLGEKYVRTTPILRTPQVAFELKV